jgi:hypothetical protein
MCESFIWRTGAMVAASGISHRQEVSGPDAWRPSSQGKRLLTCRIADQVADA